MNFNSNFHLVILLISDCINCILALGPNPARPQVPGFSPRVQRCWKRAVGQDHIDDARQEECGGIEAFHVGECSSLR